MNGLIANNFRMDAVNVAKDRQQESQGSVHSNKKSLSEVICFILLLSEVDAPATDPKQDEEVEGEQTTATGKKCIWDPKIAMGGGGHR